jgi:trk system potassium uptake protein TrkH
MVIPWSKQTIVLSPSQWMLLGFAIIISIGTLLLALPIASQSGKSLGLLNALFTSTSAVCVTGLAVVDTGQFFTHFGQIVIMLLIQIGGLGFMTYGVIIALLLGKKLGLKHRFMIQESTNSATIQGLVRLCLSIFMISLIIEVSGSLILTIHWYSELGFKQAVFYAIFHSISAFNNAGFGLWPDSLIRYVDDPVVNIVITLLIILGALGFIVILDILRKRNWRTLALNSKIVLTTSAALILAGFLVIYITEMLSPEMFSQFTWSERLWAAYFQGISPRSAGFNTIDIGKMLAASQFFIIILMFIGGASGSTGGGIKINTFTVLLLAVFSHIRGRSEIHIFHRKIATETVLRALSVIIISLGTVLLVAFLLTTTENQSKFDFIAILFEATSAFSTTGLSMGITADLTSAGKCIVIVTMFIGRLGPLTLVYALSKNKKTTKIGYAEERVLIG